MGPKIEQFIPCAQERRMAQNFVFFKLDTPLKNEKYFKRSYVMAQSGKTVSKGGGGEKRTQILLTKGPSTRTLPEDS